jgi:hypothetical protein
MERKTIKFEVKAIDEEAGIIEGYGATFSKMPDAYGDVIDPGAFTKTLKDNAGNIVSLFNHNVNEPIGLPELSEDRRGLFTKIKLVLAVQKARDTLALAKAGVIKRMSIGYDPVKTEFVDGIRHLKEVRLFDVSPVIFAANTEAMILSIKASTTFDDLPLADRERAWDAAAAERRVRAWAGGESTSWDKYSRAFMWFNPDEPELFGSYKLGFADIINDRLTAIPRGIFAIAGVLSGARGGVNIPDADAAKVRTHVEAYYKKMRDKFGDEEITTPWSKSDAAGDGGDMSDDIETKEGRTLSAASLTKIRSALEALQALVDVMDEKNESKSDPQSLEKAKLNSIIAELEAENSGFDIKDSEKRINKILEQIRGQ